MLFQQRLLRGNLSRGKDVIFPFWIYLNTKDPALRSPHIRRALSQVINRLEVAKHIYIGDKPLFKPVPHGSFGDRSSTENLMLGQKLFNQGLEELGLTKESFPSLKISFYPLGSHKEFAIYLKDTWKKALGIDVDLDGKEWSTFYADMLRGAYQMGGVYVGSDYNDPLACLELLAMENNLSNWQNRNYQQVIYKLKCENDVEKRKRLLKEAEKILQDEMPIIWVVNLTQHSSYPVNLKRLCFDQRGLPDLRWAYFE